MTSCSWIMPACTREKESKKQSQRAVQRCSIFQPIVQTSTPSNSSLPNSNPSCARSPPILSKASHSRSTACARPSSLASTRSHVQNAPHISPIRGMGNLNGKCSSGPMSQRSRLHVGILSFLILLGRRKFYLLESEHNEPGQRHSEPDIDVGP